MGLARLLARDAGLSLVDYNKLFRPGQQVTYNGVTLQGYEIGSPAGSSASYDTNGVVFACAMNRMLLFSEARFQFQQLRNGRPGDLFGTADLAVLEEPWRGATTRELLVQAELDVLMYGNSYWVNDGPYLLRLEPEKVGVFTSRGVDDSTRRQVGETLLGYVYVEDRETLAFYEPDQIAHYKPHPDRNNRFIGMSWLNPCLPDIDADTAMTEHKRSVLNSGARLGYVVTLPEITEDQWDRFVAQFRSQHEGAINSGRTLFLSGGADVKTVSQTFDDLQVKATQGAGETRIAACAGVPPVIVGLSEGLSSATYSNYGQARRRLVDGTMRPLWGSVAAALRSVVNVPPGSRLWYDDRDIPFLREDVRDQADILAADAQTLRAIIDAGFDPDAAVVAVTSGDLARLVGQHTGLFSVQLQPPTTAEPDADESTEPSADTPDAGDTADSEDTAP